jgi:hypothetical protein
MFGAKNWNGSPELLELIVRASTKIDNAWLSDVCKSVNSRGSVFLKRSKSIRACPSGLPVSFAAQSGPTE